MTRTLPYVTCVLALAGCTSTGGRFTRPPKAPNAAVGLQTDCATATVVGLRWGAAPGRVARYEISRDGALLAATGATSFADTTVSDSTHYSYSVSAVYRHGEIPTLLGNA